MCYLEISFIIDNDLKIDVTVCVRIFTGTVCYVYKERSECFENVYVNIILTKCMLSYIVLRY